MFSIFNKNKSIYISDEYLSRCNYALVKESIEKNKINKIFLNNSQESLKFMNSYQGKLFGPQFINAINIPFVLESYRISDCCVFQSDNHGIDTLNNIRLIKVSIIREKV